MRVSSEHGTVRVSRCAMTANEAALRVDEHRADGSGTRRCLAGHSRDGDAAHELTPAALMMVQNAMVIETRMMPFSAPATDSGSMGP